MDHPNSRSAINDPNQCRLCMRVCDDAFLECIFSDKEYSIAHQIFECTSIRVTKQDNLTKICKNCASLLFLTTEFRNTCFKTNRLLMEDFVILELGDWASAGNRLLLRECENFIVRHKQQVDYLYASIVSEGEQYLDGSLEIERELFGSEDQQQQQQQQQQHQQQEQEHRQELQQDQLQSQEQTDKSGERATEQKARMEQCEPDPEILLEITKFLEEQTPCNPDVGREHVVGVKRRCGLCRILSDVTLELKSEQTQLVRSLSFDNVNTGTLRICEECSILLDIIESFRRSSHIAQQLSAEERGSLERERFESLAELGKSLIEKMKHNRDVFVRLRSGANSPTSPISGSNTSAKKSLPKKCYKRAKVTCHICGKQYESWKLQTHLNEHENVRPYVCDQAGCSSTFAGLVLLNRHKKLWHTDYFYAVCSVCGKKCKTQGIYKTHLSYHEEPKLPCTVCGKLMRNKRAIWKHMKTHSNDRKHVCGVCNKTFTIAYTLRVHMRIHTNDKPYPCADCDKRFQYKCLLKNHCQRYHRITNARSET